MFAHTIHSAKSIIMQTPKSHIKAHSNMHAPRTMVKYIIYFSQMYELKIFSSS